MVTTPAAAREVTELLLEGRRISIEYGQPGLGQRDPLRHTPKDLLWRMGMNRATLLRTESPLAFAGGTLAGGSYSLFARHLGQGQWVLVIHSQTQLWGTASYDPGYDLFTVPLQASRIEMSEQLVIKLVAEGSDSARLMIDYGTVRLEAGFRLRTAARPGQNQSVGPDPAAGSGVTPFQPAG